MCTTSSESVPQAWEDERDGCFFRITAHVFSPEFVYGAGVLLATNDDLESVDSACRCAVTVTSGVRDSVELVPVRIHRGNPA